MNKFLVRYLSLLLLLTVMSGFGQDVQSTNAPTPRFDDSSTPTSPTAAAESYYWRSRSLARAGRYAEAESACRNAISINPTNADYVYELGFCLQRLHQNVEAIDTFKRALALNPADSFGWLSIGGCYYADGNYPLAALAFSRAVGLNPKNDDAFDWLSRCYSESKDYTNAEQASRQAIEINPTNVNYFLQLGFCQDAQNHYTEAVETLEKAVAMDPQNAVGFLRLGISLYHNRAFAEAVGPLQKSLQIEPTNTQSLYWLGNSYQQLGRHAQAVSTFNKQLEIDPDNFGANLACGMSLMLLGDFDAATVRFEHAQAVGPQDASLRPVLFSSYLLSAKYQKAYRLFPTQFTVAGVILAVGYVLGLGFLLRYSFRTHPQTHPSFGFSLAWLGIFFEGQLALIAFFGLLSVVNINLNPLTGILLAAIPVIYAAVRAFPRQPWGAPYVWPPKFGSAAVVVPAFLGLAFFMFFNGTMETLYIWITHSPMPGQDTIPFFKYALAKNPVTGCLALVVFVPMAEEIIFRGLLQSALGKWFSTSMSVILTALAFAVVHLQPLYLAPLFCFGLLLGWARVRTNSLGLSILLHIANNGLSLILLKWFGEGS